ncbi:MAG: hypothetical protein JWL97_2957 [Gemmatimonadales bacterium]|nr:hypothetical protein [Gemmatimonadales bacterium]
MNDQRFEHLFAAARAYYHVKDDIFNLAKEQARRQYRQTMDLLELESTPEQWRKVLEAIEAEWPLAQR